MVKGHVSVRHSSQLFLNSTTRRLAWSPESPVFGAGKEGKGSNLEFDFEPRLAGQGEQLA